MDGSTAVIPEGEVGIDWTMKKVHRQQQADKYEVLLEEVKSERTTQCDRAAKGKRVQMLQKMFH